MLDMYVQVLHYVDFYSTGLEVRMHFLPMGSAVCVVQMSACMPLLQTACTRNGAALECAAWLTDSLPHG